MIKYERYTSPHCKEIYKLATKRTQTQQKIEMEREPRMPLSELYEGGGKARFLCPFLVVASVPQFDRSPAG